MGTGLSLANRMGLVMTEQKMTIYRGRRDGENVEVRVNGKPLRIRHDLH